MPLEHLWKWDREPDDHRRDNRFPFLQPVPYESSASIGDEGAVTGRTGVGYAVNIGSGGMCCLLDWSPTVGDILRVHMPMALPLTRTPTLAEVRWMQAVPLGEGGIVIVGLEFLL